MRTSLYIFALLMFFSQSALCQKLEKSETTKTPQELYDYHIVKKKRNQTTGFVLLGAGFGLIIIEAVSEDPEPDGLGEAIAQDIGNDLTIITGGVLMASSVPFFIISGNHSRKANLALKSGAVSFNHNPIPKSNYVALSISIPIGK